MLLLPLRLISKVTGRPRFLLQGCLLARLLSGPLQAAETYEVEEFTRWRLNSQGKKGVQIEVHWRGYDQPEERTWEDLDDLLDDISSLPREIDQERGPLRNRFNLRPLFPSIWSPSLANAIDRQYYQRNRRRQVYAYDQNEDRYWIGIRQAPQTRNYQWTPLEGRVQTLVRDRAFREDDFRERMTQSLTLDVHQEIYQRARELHERAVGEYFATAAAVIPPCRPPMTAEESARILEERRAAGLLWEKINDPAKEVGRRQKERGSSRRPSASSAHRAPKRQKTSRR